MMKNYTLRLETPDDYRTVEELTRDAFWDVFKPGCDEHLILHRLRAHADFIPELSVVALDGGTIAGHAAYSRAAIVQKDGARFPIIILGPLSVLPAYQKQGVGSALLRHTLARAKETGFAGCAVCGWPDYYPRFGFERARKYAVTDAAGESPDHLMILPLAVNALPAGTLAESEVFYSVTPEALKAFDKTFPPREKHRRPGQLV
ncbi:MAG: N-acetyltransferase [Eubacteriales bacterium]|nr:N-acetyltransferase [Eubacteriales bacterium]